ncbi:MAG: N-6 DNA methylase [Candidatus Uhrbacteria bacterium]|nr:N-6 DNA methylase [Patescibacteria group bacterium]
MNIPSIDVLSKIFKNPEDDLALFDDLHVLEFYSDEKDRVYVKTLEHNGKDKVVLTDKKTAPEEIVRQLFLHELLHIYKYPKDRVKLEVDIQFGREIGKKRADVVVYREDMTTPYLMVEVKKPDVKDGLGQLKSYANATGAPILILTDGKIQNNLLRTDPNLFEDLPDLPKFNETVEDVQKKVITYDDLDDVNNLKQLILDLENAVLANAGVNPFEEIFKLIYAKLYDELETPRSQNRRFRVIAGITNKDNLNNISRLFNEAKGQWRDVFKDKDEIEIPENAIVPAVSLLQKYRLFGSNLQVIDDAFEYLINQDAKGGKGQYFTPRFVIDMCVKMMRPKKNENIVDTAAGSCGFLLHSMQHVWRNEITEENYGSSFESKRKEYADQHLYAIDFDPRSVKIGKAMMLIAGDGKTNVSYANSLDSSLWDTESRARFSKFLHRFEDFDLNKKNEEAMTDFDFDLIVTNPPFAGEVKGTLLNKYDLGFKYNKDFERTNKHQNKMTRDVLFIERNLDFLKPGGRMAIVLPQGIFNNANQEYIRRYIMKRARLLAVVGLHGNSFKPHTGTKTSALFLQKWQSDEEREQAGNYPIFMATSEKPGKNNSGDYIYAMDEHDNIKKDENGSYVYDTDLDDIADKFIEFAKKHNFDFI